jgi:putative nucleotidyltransferase with HDIG domain
MKKRVLFVDDERNVLEGLKRMLRDMRHEWEMAFAGSGQEALEILGREAFDVVVSDMRMPGMDGCQFLSKVQEGYPHIIRIILSGYSDREIVLKSVRVAHQYLSKPCDSETLRNTVARAFALRDLLVNKDLLDVISRMETLPSVPSIYHEVIHELSASGGSIHKVAAIISKDVGMTAKILHLANSAFFGLHQSVNNLERALTLLGFDTVAALVITVQIFSMHSHAWMPGFSIPALWDHSMTTAALAKAIAKEEKQERSEIEDAFMGGLLHDVGQVILATSLSESYQRVMILVGDRICPLWKAELEVFGTTHAEVGAYLMGLWGLPDPIVEAIAFHHSPRKRLAQSFGPLTAVHVGDALAHSKCPTGTEDAENLLDLDYLADLDLTDRLAAWETVCRKHTQQGASDG